ncbi:hypothetical protein [Helicobacter pylori]|uniref:hypothetical protein n=1 Tax=Helicobacter pylori TaxID=210 RepID=UPI00165C731E|nr:hypothetical protein [Helicobacter pylori]
MFGNPSNDTQENPKDAQKKEEALKKVQEVQEENAKLNRDKTDLARERDKLERENKNLTTDKERLERENKNLTADKENLTKEKNNLNDQLNASQKQVQALEQSQQALKNEKAELSKEKENLTKDKTELTEKNKVLTTEKERLEREGKNLTADKENLTIALSTAKSQAEQTFQKLNELERRHAPYQKLEKLYEVFLGVKDCLNFNFVATTHSAMDLIVSVLSDSKYYLESLYNKASQELSDKRSDKGEKLAELFDLLFEYIKDSKFERLKEPSAYDHTCKKLYPEQNSSQKIQRVVLRGYMYDKKIACYTIVDMGS